MRLGVECLETEEAYVIGMAGLSCYEFHQAEREIQNIPKVELDIKKRLTETPWSKNILDDQIKKCGHCHTCPKN